MYRLFTCIQQYFKAIIRKLKELFLDKNLHRAALFLTAAVIVFYWGRYRTRRYLRKKYHFQPFAVRDDVLWGNKRNLPIELAGLFGNSKVRHPMWGQPFNSYYPEPIPFDLCKDRMYRTQQIMSFGYPGTDNVRNAYNYVISYNNGRRMINWVYEHWNADIMNPISPVDVTDTSPKFDKYVHDYFRTEPEDYDNSGYHRHPLVSVLHHLEDPRYLEESCFITHMVPLKDVGCWVNIERHVDELTNTFTSIHCCSGTLFLPKVKNGLKYMEYKLIGKNRMAVPTHLFKVIFARTESNELAMESYLVPNDGSVNEKTPLRKVQVDIEFLERVGGFLFMNYLSKLEIKFINGRRNFRYIPPRRRGNRFIWRAPRAENPYRDAIIKPEKPLNPD